MKSQWEYKAAVIYLSNSTDSEWACVKSFTQSVVLSALRPEIKIQILYASWIVKEKITTVWGHGKTMRQIIYLINSHLSHWVEECNFPFISLALCFSVDQDVPILLTSIYSHESGSGYRAVTCESNSELVTGRVLSSQYVHTTRQLKLLMWSCRPIVDLCEQKWWCKYNCLPRKHALVK